MNKKDRLFYTLLGTIGLLIGGGMFVQDLMANGVQKNYVGLGVLGLAFFVLISIPSKDRDSNTQNHIEMAHYHSPNVIVKPFSVVETLQNPTDMNSSFCGKCGTKFDPDSLDIFCTKCGNSRGPIE